MKRTACLAEDSGARTGWPAQLRAGTGEGERQGLQLVQGEMTGAGAFNGGSRLSGIKNAKYLLRRE